MHPSERARAFRETVSTVEVDDVMYGQPVRRLAPTIPPRSHQETEALAEIDQRRARGDEPCLSCGGVGCDACGMTGWKIRPTKQTRRRHRQYWSDRDRHVK